MMDIFIYIVVLIFTGCFGGILSGFLGLGGGVLYVPVLITLFEINDPGIPTEMHTAIGTSLALLIPGALSSVHKHFKSGNITFSQVWRWCVFVFFGAIIGSVIVHVMSEFVLKVIFNAFVYFCIGLLFFKKEEVHGVIRKVSLWIMYSYAFIVGTICVMLGIGGGTLTVPFYKILRHPYRHAVAVSSAGAIVIGITGAILMIVSGMHGSLSLPHFSIGYVNWLAFICVSPLAIVFANLGAKWVTNCPEKVTKMVYLLVLLASAVYMTVRISLG